ncbi:MAG: histidine ammonia-lyase [Saprospiraceae bacterium]
MTTYTINNTHLTAAEVLRIIKSGATLQLDQPVRKSIEQNRQYLESKIAHPDSIVYGINTGFGSLCNVHISEDKLEHLQENLVLSHACGMGETVPYEIVKIILFLKIVNLSKGHSGVRPQVLDALIALYNHNIIPVLYQQGSLGASGDLAPLAHLSLPLIGYGKVYYNGSVVESRIALDDAGISAITLKSKEGLALLNGTQFSLGYAVHICGQLLPMWNALHAVSAMSLDAFYCDSAPFNTLLHDIRPHDGQKLSAELIRSNLKDSPIAQIKKETVQDPYSFRCIPQVHGASYSAFMHTISVVETEINSVTDNPLIFDEDDVILSGGNFHAQPLALVLDYIAIAMAELGNISERRVYQLINGDRGLPAFLTKNPGLDSGFMIVQYTAASIVSQSKQYCTPASVDSIVSSKGQEDHVSMAANGATKALKVFENLKRLIAIEYLTAAQALDFRRPIVSSHQVELWHKHLRCLVPFLDQDRLMHDDMMLSLRCLEENMDTFLQNNL